MSASIPQQVILSADAPSAPIVAHAADDALADGGRLPCLDGLRALSIAFVIVGHLWWGEEGTLPPLQDTILTVIGNTRLGVSIFFVISGFLITWLLVREHQHSGTISLRRFYIRRAFRILPAYFAFLGVMALVRASGAIDTTWHDFAVSAAFLRNYMLRNSTYEGGWWLGHTWTLSLEEQFYLLWPALLLGVGLLRGRWVAVGLILLTPVIRVVTYVVAPDFRVRIGMMLHTRADALMFGCLLALVLSDATLRAHARRLVTGSRCAIASLFLFLVSPFLVTRWEGAYLLPVGNSLEGLAIAMLICWLLLNAKSRAGRFFDGRAISAIGVLSYSLYLWQQPFARLAQHGPAAYVPLYAAAIFVAAWASHRYIEQPFLRLKQRFAA